MGADVTILDNQIIKLARLEEQYQSRVRTLFSNRKIWKMPLYPQMRSFPRSWCQVPGLLISSRLTWSAHAPGSVIVDIAIDQGGSVETIPTAPLTTIQS